ncbi:spermidine/putrescine ABC transporter substrate-binding protein [Leucobacter allii]|uniref:Spermidine/putrescine ABC transporter substrate-binding protein n=1 Tax=Leucobacter allii TaxID=2932247 RepID=A0ABY4FPV7_9MICO|nr:spermidine/putrescine ABC transporter substrate-binding protein [Leucobacter allii]UOQ58313.1 spermidine/putrescine ABC transporter substrate-binding protein [Leucobacter allii]UOR02892.1 spermidine/putrescine ABC transporter substrate-binding protein [Leucobacter allii]
MRTITSHTPFRAALASVAAAALLFGATACAGGASSGGEAAGGSDAAFPEQGSGEVNLFNFTNYISPDALEKFTADTGITVNVDTFSSAEEMVAKVKTGSATYDVVTVSDYVAGDLIASGQLAEIDTTTFPNGGNIEDAFVDAYFDEGRKYTSPYAVVYQGIGVNPEVVTEPVASWADYFAAPASAGGKIGLHDSQTYVIDAALMAVGAEACSTDNADYQRALDLLNEFKPSIKIISSDGTIDRLAGGETVLSTMWNGSFARAQAQDPALEYVFPEEGFMMGSDNLAILTNAQNQDNAKIFLNWMLDPENAAINADFIKYTSPVEGIEEFLPEPGDGDAPVIVADAETMERAHDQVPCSADVKEQYDKLWTMFKG